MSGRRKNPYLDLNMRRTKRKHK